MFNEKFHMSQFVLCMDNQSQSCYFISQLEKKVITCRMVIFKVADATKDFDWNLTDLFTDHEKIGLILVDANNTPRKWKNKRVFEELITLNIFQLCLTSTVPSA